MCIHDRTYHLGVTAQSRTQVFHSGFVWQLWRTKSGTGSITVHSERNTQILLKKKVYKCSRKLQFGHRTFSYSHIVLYVVCSSKLFLCGMTSFLTCPLPGSGCHSSLWLSQSHQRCLTCSGPESVWRHSLCSFLPCRRGGRVAAWSAW